MGEAKVKMQTAKVKLKDTVMAYTPEELLSQVNEGYLTRDAPFRKCPVCGRVSKTQCLSPDVNSWAYLCSAGHRWVNEPHGRE